MAQNDFLSLQLRDAEERAAKAKDNLAASVASSSGASASDTPARPSASTTSSPGNVDESPSRDKRPAKSTRTRKCKMSDAPRTRGRPRGPKRDPHTLTFLPDVWDEMLIAADASGVGVSYIIEQWWRKSGRRKYGITR